MSKSCAGRAGLTAASFAVLALAAWPAAAMGQTAEPAAADKDDDVIVVTATRREQALQDTPIAITAVTGDQLQQQNIVSVSDLQRVAPTLLIRSSNSETGGTTVRIRGVGTQGNNPGLEGAVGIFIDGVYRQRAGLAMSNLFDTERVEVLRGPQGTLFGKNTSAGAISIQLRTPQLGETEGLVRLGLGDFNNREAEGMLNLPIGDMMALRLSGAWQARDGYLGNVSSGAQSQDRDRFLGRAMLLWEATPDWSFRLTVDAAEKDEACCNAVYRIVGPATAITSTLSGASIPLPPDELLAATNATRPFLDHTDDFGVSGHVQGTIGKSVDFRAILARRTFDAQASLDVDYSPADLLFQSTTQSQSLTTFEATLNGQWGAVDWLVGAFTSQEDLSLTNVTGYGTQLAQYITPLSGGLIGAAAAAALYPANGGTTASAFSQDTSSWSVFAHNQIKLTPIFGAVVGLRYNHEEKSGGMSLLTTTSPSCGGGPFHGQGAAPPPGLPSALRILCPRPTYFAETSESKLTGTFGLNAQFTDNLFSYVSYSRGFKAGGINLDRDAPAAAGVNPASGLVNATQGQVNAAVTFRPEFADSYEVGLRSQFFDRRLTMNMTLFRTEFEDFQLNTFNGVGFAIANAGSVTSEGVELESLWRPTSDWTIGFGLVYLDARYGDDALLRFDPPDQLPAPNQDLPLAGRRIDGAPEWTGSLSLRREWTLTDAVSTYVDISANYRSSYNTASDLVLAKEQPGHTLVNARVGLFNPTLEGWEASLWGTNLTDVYTQVVAFDSVLQNGSLSEFPGAPRMWGVTLTRRF